MFYGFEDTFLKIHEQTSYDILSELTEWLSAYIKEKEKLVGFIKYKLQYDIKATYLIEAMAYYTMVISLDPFSLGEISLNTITDCKQFLSEVTTSSGLNVEQGVRSLTVIEDMRKLGENVSHPLIIIIVKVACVVYTNDIRYIYYYLYDIGRIYVRSIVK